MKTSNNPNNRQSKQPVHKTRPEIRDNLDSRKNEEQLRKGDDTTHNTKDVKSEKRGGQTARP